MRVFVLSVLAAAFLSILPAPPAGAQQVSAESTFDSSTDAWTSDIPGDIARKANGGQSGGFMRFNDTVGGGTFLIAPAKFLGDYRPLARKTGPVCGARPRPARCDGSIAFFHRIVAVTNVVSIDPYSVVMSGPGGSATWKGAVPEGETGWVKVKAPLRKSHWVVTSGDWNGLLANVTDMRVQIELVGNTTVPGDTDVEGLDQIQLLFGKEE